MDKATLFAPQPENGLLISPGPGTMQCGCWSSLTGASHAHSPLHATGTRDQGLLPELPLLCMLNNTFIVDVLVHS